VLMWARSQHPPCPWSEQTCASAAAWGHLHVLMWARSQHPPCPWDEHTCMRAAQSAPLEVLQWAVVHGAPIPPSYAQWYEHLLRGEPHAMDHHRTFEV